MTAFHRAINAMAVQRHAESWAVQYVEPAFNGDVEAASRLASALGNEKRGAVAVSMWRSKVARPAFAAFLKEVWLHDHLQLVRDVGSRRNLQHMFRYAGFPRDAEGPTVKVWRGFRGQGLEDVHHGFSWTTNRDIACWFAILYLERFPKPGSVPLVASAEVPLESIAWLTNERDEEEALILAKVRGARIDESHADWLECAMRHSAKEVATKE